MNMLSAQTHFHYTFTKGAAIILQKCSDQSLANIIAGRCDTLHLSLQNTL